MDGYFLDVTLAVAVATATIFIGFLPTKSIRAPFFGRESLVTSIAWLLVSLGAPAQGCQYPIFIALFCFGAWWQFRVEKMLRGKMWLSLASGLGVSVGVMVLLYTSPRVYPIGYLESPRDVSLLVSIYLGGAILGLAYTVYRLIHEQARGGGIPDRMIARHAGLLFLLTLLRVPVLLLGPVTEWQSRRHYSDGGLFGLKPTLFPPDASAEKVEAVSAWFQHPPEAMMVFLGTGLVLPVLAGLIWKMPGSRRRAQVLLLFLVIGFGIEVLARRLVL